MSGYVVVLLTGSECEKYPGQTCVMDVLGPYTREEAERVFAVQPKWSCPHIMTMPSDQERTRSSWTWQNQVHDHDPRRP